MDGLKNINRCRKYKTDWITIENIKAGISGIIPFNFIVKSAV